MMQRNIIYILLFILFCQCTSAIRKDIKWIAITDIYEEFGINSYDIEFDEFYFVDENTLILSGFKGIGTPSRTGIIFISKDLGKTYHKIEFVNENIYSISVSKDYCLIETEKTDNQRNAYLLNNSNLNYERIGEYDRSIFSYGAFNGKILECISYDISKFTDIETHKIYNIPENWQHKKYRLHSDNTLYYVENKNLYTYNLLTQKEDVKVLSQNYDVLSVKNDDIFLVKFNFLKDKATLYNLEEREIYTESEEEIKYYKYKDFICHYKSSTPYIVLNYSFDKGKNWYSYEADNFFAASRPVAYYKDRYIVLKGGVYRNSEKEKGGGRIMVGEFVK